MVDGGRGGFLKGHALRRRPALRLGDDVIEEVADMLPGDVFYLGPMVDMGVPLQVLEDGIIVVAGLFRQVRATDKAADSR